METVPPHSAARQRPLLALVVRLAGVAAVSVMLLLVKLSNEHGVALPELLFWRQLIPTVLIAGWLALRGQVGRLRTRRIGAHARRTVLGNVGMGLNFLAVTLLPLAEATVLGFTAPLFATALAALLLRERVGAWRWSAVVLGLTGVVMIAGFDAGRVPLTGLAVGLSAALAVALIVVQLRDLGRTETPICVVFWFSALSLPMLLPFVPFFARPHDSEAWLLVLATGVVGLISQIGLTASLRIGSVSSVTVMDYSAFGWAALWGWLVFAQTPSAATWIGAPVVAAAGIIVLWREQRGVPKAVGSVGA